MGISARNSDRKPTKTTESDKRKKKAEMNRNRREKTTQEKLTIQLEEIYQKVLAKEGRLKRYRQRVRQYRQNRTFQNNERKFFRQLGGDDNKTYQQPNAKETERFWTKIWQPKQHNEKAEWINHTTRELEQLEEGPKAEIHTDLFKTTLKTVSNWKKKQVMIEYMVFGSRSSPQFTTDYH